MIAIGLIIYVLGIVFPIDARYVQYGVYSYCIYGIHKLHVMLQIRLSTTDNCMEYGYVSYIRIVYNTFRRGYAFALYILSEPGTGKL